jgi:hypothetical protein
MMAPPSEESAGARRISRRGRADFGLIATMLLSRKKKADAVEHPEGIQIIVHMSFVAEDSWSSTCHWCIGPKRATFFQALVGDNARNPY